MDTTAEVLQGMIVERQRLLIREANYLRSLVNLPPVAAQAGDDDQQDDVSEEHPATFFSLTRNRRAVVRAVALTVAKREQPSFTTVFVRSGVARGSFARAVAWATSAGVLTRSGRCYLPGPAWGACVDSDAELLGLVAPANDTANDTGSIPTRGATPLTDYP